MLASAARRSTCFISLLLLVAAGSAFADHHEASGPTGIEGAVLETMDAGGYTYLRVKTADGDIWAAGPRAAVAVGDHVALSPGSTMLDFHSATLDRTFDSIQFVGAIRVVDKAEGTREEKLAGAHGSVSEAASGATGPVARAEGGLTVAEIYAGGSQLAGKPVVIRGRVMKFNEGILGKNWIHIQDGTGGEGTHDLTVTTDAVARVGDVILVRGVVATDRDFGAGYRYDLIVEEAAITVE